PVSGIYAKVRQKFHLSPLFKFPEPALSKETSQKIAEVDRLADEVAEAADAFERTFRKLSPESYLGGANV
ncbi:hypothetical protein GOD47_10985, partial [Sinorhizobium medicae]|nr:hypothetical protein [Sinorhizobium medicae]MDX0725569.1 hypothetical protein [Sinorhizobium medicae]MDX0731556.1 hypothetical protein [Sinorhizobium medicae]MDX0811644.1 hypothetical protein [Sinorhizobium medicae]